MIALGTLVGTQVHKRNVSEDLKKLEEDKEINKAAGKPEVDVLHATEGMKTKEGKEAASYEVRKTLASAINPKNQAAYDPSYVESPEDTYEDIEALNREYNIPTQSAQDSVSKMIESKKRLDQIKSNYKDKVTFETATKNMQLSKGAWNKNMDDIIKKGGK